MRILVAEKKENDTVTTARLLFTEAEKILTDRIMEQNQISNLIKQLKNMRDKLKDDYYHPSILQSGIKLLNFECSVNISRLYHWLATYSKNTLPNEEHLNKALELEVELLRLIKYFSS